MVLLVRAILAALLLAGAVFLVRGESLVLLDYLRAGMTGLLISLLWLYLRSVVQPVIPLLLVPLTALTVGIVLAVPVLLELPAAALAEPDHRAVPAGPAATYLSGTIQQGRSYSLYVGRHRGSELSDAILVNHSDIPRMRHYEELHWDYVENTLIIPGEGEISTREIMSYGGVREPIVFVRLADDIGRVITLLDAPLRSPGTIATLLALSFSLAMVWTAARLTRWPLANAVFTLAALVGILAVPRLQEEYSPFTFLTGRFQIAAALPLEEYALPISLLLPGLILLGTGLFLPRFARWQREMRPLEEGS